MAGPKSTRRVRGRPAQGAGAPRPGGRAGVAARAPVAAPAPRAAARPEAGSAAAADDGVPAWAERVLEEVLTPTFWFDPGESGGPFRVTVWFSGRRAGVTGKPGSGDAFRQEVTAEGVVPGSGPVAVTAEVRGITPGEWIVTARPVARAGGRAVRAYAPGRDGKQTGRRGALWPRRVAVPAGPQAAVRTARLAFTKIPGIKRLAYSGLICAGVLAGLAVQASLLAWAGLPWAPALVFSLYAVVAGLAGAKVWFIAVHRGRKFEGWCIQGFVAGAAVLAAAAPVAVLGVPVGAYCAAAAAGLLIGMGIGRPGCFWAGCCAGKATASRWGIWSSDRRIGCRRLPVQPLEALLAVATGLAALAVVLLLGPARSGPVGPAALAAYTLGRQLLLGLRADPPRRSPRGGLVTAAAAAVVLIASITVLALGAA